MTVESSKADEDLVKALEPCTCKVYPGNATVATLVNHKGCTKHGLRYDLSDNITYLDAAQSPFTLLSHHARGNSVDVSYGWAEK